MSSFPTKRRAAKRRRYSRATMSRAIPKPVFQVAPATDMAMSAPGWSISKLNGYGGRGGPEWKFNDVTQNAGAPQTPIAASSAGVFFCLNGLVPGSGPSQRIGTIINMTTIEYRLAFTSSTAAPATLAGQLRTILFYDKQANAQIPAIGPNDLLQTANYIVSPRGMNQRRRYKILSDKLFNYSPLTAGGPPAVTFNHFIRFRRPLQVQYNAGTTGDQTDIVTNTLWLLVVSSTSSASSVLYQFHVRVRYTD